MQYILGLVMFLTLLGTAKEIISQSVGIIYPAYKSLLALESTADPEDDKMWLTYWVCFALFYMFDQLMGKFCLKRIIPFYFFLKIGFLVFLMHPRTKGALLIYSHILQPFLSGNRV